MSIYEKIVVNEQVLANVRRMCDSRKGPIVFCPTHRSYVDFLLVSLVLYYYQMEVPHICSGEDFLSMVLVGSLLRSAGAFFMRRSFREDELYKAIFKEYVTILAADNTILEFFIEGTRSRTNKTMYPKYGFLSILTQAYYKGRLNELTFIPVTINYTRTLEGETFPFELTGEAKVKESLSRLLKAIQIFSMNLGTIYLDFCEPIVFSEFEKKQKEQDRLKIANNLGLEIVYTFLRNVRIMPTNLVAGILLLQRKGISKDDLERKVRWLGQTLQQKGYALSTYGLPSVNTLKIGLNHLADYVDWKRDIVMPKVGGKDFKNLMMLAYYRNPLNQIFFNEGIIIVSMFAFGEESVWKSGVDIDKMFEKACFLSNLLAMEEV